MSHRRRRSRSRAIPRRNLALLGLVGMLIAGGLVWVGFNAPNDIPGRSYYVVQAEFHHADNLTAHFQVRVGGKLVGQVLRPRVEDGKAVVDLQLEPDVGPLLSDTRAVVRPRSAIGVRYLDVIPGTKGHALADGERIPAAQTAVTVALDDALDTLDATRRVRAQELLTSLGAGLAGRGDGLSAGLRETDDLVASAGRTLETVNARRGAFGRLITASRDLAVAAEPVRDELAVLPGEAAAALQPLVDRSAAVERTLAVAPGTLGAVERELGRTEALLRKTGRLTTRLRPALREAPATLVQASRLLQTAGPGVRDLRGTLERVQRAVPSTVTALRDVRGVLPALDTGIEGLTPLVVELGPRGCDIKRMAFNWQDMLSFGVPIKDQVLGGWLNTLRLTVIASSESLAGSGPALKDLTRTRRNHYPRPCEAGTEARR